MGEEVSEDGCRAGSSLEPDLSEEVSEDDCRGVVVRRGQLRENCTSAAGERRECTSREWDRAAGQGSVSFVGRRARRRLLEARTERAVIPHVLVHVRMGEAPLSGHTLESRTPDDGPQRT